MTREPDLAPVSERAALTAFLDKQRNILVRKIEGVTDDDARLAPTASALSLLGIRKHCALWERRWFQVIFAGRSIPGDWPEVRSKIGTDTIDAHRRVAAGARVTRCPPPTRSGKLARMQPLCS